MSDTQTAQAFATSWNNLPEGSVYTFEQFEDWLAPLSSQDVAGKRVLELGCGNGSLLLHMVRWKPEYLEGVDLGDSVLAAHKNLSQTNFTDYHITQSDLTQFQSAGFDLVYCIGVLHHLKDPRKGFAAVLRNVKRGGRFHCWVYAWEGNMVIRLLVEPLRRIFSRFPWWFTKYGVATPLAIPFYLYAKFISLAKNLRITKWLPLRDYCLWIAKREYDFFRHVAFDQLVTPQTVYLKKDQIQKWLDSSSEIDKDSTYLIFRNGNSWKFGGKKKPDE